MRRGSGAETQADAFRGIELPDSPPAPGFSLHDQNGKLVTLSSQRGHWVLLTFLYTYCPDVCPVIAGNLNAALRTAPGRRAGLRVLSISVDPKRDTPAAAARVREDHNLAPAFSWLLGSQAELARVWDAYNIAVLPGPKKTVSHSTMQLLDRPRGPRAAPLRRRRCRPPTSSPT